MSSTPSVFNQTQRTQGLDHFKVLLAVLFFSPLVTMLFVLFMSETWSFSSWFMLMYGCFNLILGILFMHIELKWGRSLLAIAIPFMHVCALMIGAYLLPATMP